MLFQVRRFLLQRLTALLLVQLMTLAGCGAEEGGDGILAAGTTDPYILEQRQTIFDLTNDERSSAGASALVADPALDAVAQAHAEDMAVRGYFDHTNPDGESPFDRMRNAGISFGYAGENIAWYPSAESAVTGWINSPGHHSNMINGNFRKIGIGVYKADPSTPGNFHYVQLFTD